MKLNFFTILFYLILKINSKNDYNRKLEEVVYTKKELECIEISNTKNKMKHCLETLKIHEKKKGQIIIKKFCDISIENIKNELTSKKQKIPVDLNNYFKKIDIYIFKNINSIKLEENKLEELKKEYNKNLSIYSGLEKIKKLLNRLIIIDDVFSIYNLKNYSNIKKEFSKNLENTQIKNEKEIIRKFDNLEKKSADFSKKLASKIANKKNKKIKTKVHLVFIKNYNKNEKKKILTNKNKNFIDVKKDDFKNKKIEEVSNNYKKKVNLKNNKKTKEDIIIHKNKEDSKLNKKTNIKKEDTKLNHKNNIKEVLKNNNHKKNHLKKNKHLKSSAYSELKYFVYLFLIILFFN